MPVHKLSFILAGSLLVSSGAILAKHEPKAPPEARETGEAVSCISISQIRESRVRNDQVIDFRTGTNKWYRNTLPNSCPSLGFEERFLYKTSLSQLCSVDIITVLHTAGGSLTQGASCGLGKFQPVELIKKAK
ncbi:MAG: hypothetical protein IPO97_01400 [Sphingomonadales bacterium]|nr:hypothetical protein [Sphingomonadales bacterium]